PRAGPDQARAANVHFTDRRRHLLNRADFFDHESMRQKSLVDQLHNAFIIRFKPDCPKMSTSYFHSLQVSSQRLTLDSMSVGRYVFNLCLVAREMFFDF